MQGVLGGSATRAGRTITPLFLAWSISAAVAAKVVVRFGFRATAVVGSILIASGSIALAVGSRYPAWAGPVFSAAMVVVGLGMGPASLCYILGVQGAVDWGKQNLADLTQTARNLQIRWTNQGHQFPPPVSSRVQQRFGFRIEMLETGEERLSVQGMMAQHIVEDGDDDRFSLTSGWRARERCCHNAHT